MDSLWSSDSLLGLIKNMSLHWEVPLFSAAVYVVWVLRNNKRIREKNEKMKILDPQTSTAAGETETAKRPTQKKSLQLKSFIFLHNMGMSLFSMLIFKKTFDITWGGFCSLSFNDFIADSDKKLEKQLAPWVWIFYLSKYYEIVDTLILFLSEKESSFLQMYHHAGAIVGCWLVSLGKSHSAWVWIGLNSFIHSIMYMYYALTVIGFRAPFKRLITFMQIAQFIVGMFFGLIYITHPNTFSTDYTLRIYQYAAILFNIVYVIILTGLFIDFERTTYRKSSENKEKVRHGESVDKSIPVIPSPTSSAILTPS